MDWSSFYINILAGAIFFVLGILFSIWLIPRYTLKLIKKKNITYFNKKISFIIFELCEFLNGMPKEFKVNNGSTTFKVKNEKYPDLYDFVAILNPNVLQPVAPEQLSLNIIKTVNYYTGKTRYEFVCKELARLKLLQSSIENILSTHSVNIDEELISDLSSLCLSIRTMEIKFRFNEGHEKLTGKKEGIFGSDQINKIYAKIINLLLLLEKEDGVKRE